MAEDDTDLDLGGDQQSNYYQDYQAEHPSFRSTSPGVYSPGGTSLPSQGLTRPSRDPYDVARFPPLQPGIYRLGTEAVPQEPEGGSSGLLRDFSRQIWTATLGAGDSILGAAKALNDSLGADPSINQFIKSGRSALADHVAATIHDMTPERQKALQASIMPMLGGREYDSAGNKIPTPGDVGWANYFAAQIAGLVPMGVLAFLPGGVVGKALGAVGFGALNAGDVYNSISDQLDKTSDAQLQQQSPAYQTLRQTMGVDEAKAQLLQHVAPTVATLGFASGAAGGAALGVGGIGSTVTRRALTGAGIGALGMGGQGAADTAIQQWAQQPEQMGGRQGFDPSDMLAEAVSQGIGGAVLGGIGGAFHREKPAAVERPAAELTPTTQVAPENAAALQAALETPGIPEQDRQAQQIRDTLTSTPAGYGATPQAEMFQPFEMGGAPPPGPGMPAGARQAEMFPVPGGGRRQGQAEAFPPTEMGPAERAAATVPVEAPAVTPPGMEAPPESRPIAPGMPEEAQQGEMFPTAAPAAPVRPVAAEMTLPPTKPTEPTKPTIAPAGPRPSEGMKVQELRDALSTMPGQDPRAIKRMGREDLARAYDRAAQPSPEGQVTAGPEVTTVAKGVEGGRTPATPEPMATQAAAEAPTAKPPSPVAGSLPTSVVGETPSMRETALEHLATARQRMGELPPGPQRTQVNKVMKDFQTAIANAKTLDDLLATFRAAQQHGDPLSKGIAQYIEQRMSGRAPERTKAPAESTRPEHVSEAEEVAREERARGQESKVAPESIEETAVGQGPGGETMGLPTKEAPVRKGTDYEAIGRSLLNKVLDESDPMDVHQAAERFGKQPPGPGRPRRAETKDFGRVIDKEIERVTKPGVREKLEEQLRQALIDEQHAEPGEAKTSVRLEKALEDYAPERVARLQEMRRELADPVGKAADDEATRQARKEAIAAQMRERLRNVRKQMAPGIFGKDYRESRYVRMSQDVRLERGLVRMMNERENAGHHLTAHEIAKYIAQDPLVNSEAQPFARFATQLLRLMPDIPVYSHDFAYERGLITRDVYNQFKQGYGFTEIHEGPGGAFGAPKHIIMNINRPHMHGSHLGTFIHEAVHAVTSPYIDHLMRTAPDHPHMQAMQHIFDELHEHLRLEADDMTKLERDNVGYALQNAHELATMALQDPTVQAFMARVQASDYFKQKMSSLGYAPGQTRSVWRYFTDWVRKALGMEGPASASEYALLDHVLRPLQDVADAGAQYNSRFLPKDPMLRPPAATLGWNLDNQLARDVGRHMDLPGLGDRARRAFLRVTNRDAIVDRYKDILPSLTTWRRADENIRAASSRFANEHSDAAQALLDRLNKADAKNDLQNLMTDATTAEVKLGAGADNSHLTKADQQAALQDLQGRYAKLSAKDQQLYQDFKNFYQKTHEQMRAADLEGLVNGFMPDATAAQRKAFMDGVRTKAQLDQFLADPDNSNIAQAFGSNWAAERATARGLAQIHARGFTQGDYFPLRRFGNYVVRYGDRMDPDKYGVEFFDKRTDAVARRAELVKQGRDDVYQVARRDDTQFGDMRPNLSIMQELADKLERQGASEAHITQAVDNLRDVLMRHATRSEAARQAQRRRGVRGASTDQGRVLAHDLVSNVQRIGYALHGSERAAELQKIHNEMKEAEGPRGAEGAAIKAAAVYHEIQQRMSRPEDFDNTIHKLGRLATTFSYMQSLMSPSHMLTSTLETHANSMALLGARHGYARTALALTRALGQGSVSLTGGARNTVKALGNRLKATDWNMLHAVRDEMMSKPGADKAGLKMLFDELERTGLVDHTFLKDIRDRMVASDLMRNTAQKTWNIFYNTNGAMAHAVDVLNKSAVAKAAYDLEFRKTGDRKAAVEYAIQQTRRVMPNYTTGNRERIAQNPIAGALLQFKRYGMHMYALMANLAHEAARGPNKAEAAKALAGVLGSHALLAGSLTLLADPLRYIGGAYDLATGAPTFHNYQNNARGFLSDVMGPELAEIVARGLPHYFGIDLHRRVGLANLLEIPEMDAFNKEGAAKVLLGLATGATGENLANIVDGLQKAMHGDIVGGMNVAIPRVFRDVSKGVTAATEGIKDRTGKVILPPEKVGVSGGIAQALGFQPSAVSEFREGRNAVLEERQEQQAEHRRLTSAWLNAEPEDRADVMSQIRDFNADPYNRGSRITMESLLRSRREQQKQANMPFGLRLPKGSQLSEAGRFAQQ